MSMRFLRYNHPVHILDIITYPSQGTIRRPYSDTMLLDQARKPLAAPGAQSLTRAVIHRSTSHLHSPWHQQASNNSSRLGRHTRVHFKAESQQQDSSQDSSSMQRWEPLQRFDHWSTLLTTMPGLNASSWCGRLGEFVMHTGPSNSDASLAGSGAILHLWRAALAEPDEAASAQQQGGGITPGQQSEVASAVDIRYFTANGVSVTRKQRDASGADTGSHADRALSNDGSQVVWDQALLAAHPTCFVFSPDSPQLSLTLADWQSQVPVLHRVLRLLPLSSSGVAIVNAALPGSFGPEVAEQSPPGSYWFFESCSRMLTRCGVGDES
ncbi:hypothetical protein COO60DRAFT_1516770 [Scenedesmus sp. NREL 46B-D3]|nr:hypothetical protein COO60DRAFT_1516770 [Scenedesmus sp. NREL 46B-D3]